MWALVLQHIVRAESRSLFASLPGSFAVLDAFPRPKPKRVVSGADRC